MMTLPRALFASLASLLAVTCLADTVTYDFNVGWVTANPDGMFERLTMGINGKWPLPVIEATKGDRIIVNLQNNLVNQSTSLHFHGLFQNGTSYMDGPVGVTQCEVSPGSSIVYNFTVEQAGTYWYHSHSRGQYPDGLRGPVLIHDTPEDAPYLQGTDYDSEMVMSLSDWYHDQMPALISGFINIANPTGAEPVPNSALMNDQQNTTFSVEPGKTYLIHIVNMAAFAAQYLWFEGHKIEIVEVDGVWTERAEAEMIYITAAQRYSILLTAKDNTDQNYAIIGSMDQDLFDSVPPSLNPNVTGYLVYDNSKAMPIPALVDEFNPYDDFTLVPSDGEYLWEDPVQTIQLDMKMDNLGDGANYAFFNDITYTAPIVPTLYSALTTGEDATNPKVYGSHTNPFVLGHNQVVELVLNSADPGKHPFHLHGHTFQTLVRADEDTGVYDPANHTAFPKIPMRRDVLLVKPNSNFVIRWRSDNPGIWLFHCHIEWHVDSGLIMTIVEAPMELQKQLSIDTLPASHIDVCKAAGTPMRGNAAANTKDVLDLTGQREPPAPLPAGFEAKGIVALVFSCIAAILGMAAVAWYGAKPLSDKEEKIEEDKVAHMAGAS